VNLVIFPCSLRKDHHEIYCVSLKYFLYQASESSDIQVFFFLWMLASQRTEAYSDQV